jgi:hypothetical protein
MKGAAKGGEVEEHGEEIVLSITTAVRTSNPTKLFSYRHTTGCSPRRKSFLYLIM